MKRRQVARLVVLGGVAVPLAGCSNEAADGGDENDDAGEDTDDEDGSAEEDGSADESNEREFSGTGSEALEDIGVEGGLTVVDATHEGDGEFQVRLIPGGGEGSEDDAEDASEPESTGTLFADSSGGYEGQTAWHMEGGTYQLSVVAGGDWTVTVREPRETTGETPPVSLEGTGNEVHGPFEFDGAHQPSGDYDGTEINVTILSTTREATQFVFHEDSIENPTEFEFDGVGYVEIKSDGEWSVDIE
ncbi:hypothetical protein A6E15_11465 [Natrinema saccharevitans]|uniref:Cell surface glycoprotein n=1 Tax=Natrinema saccharevitans TaxID=301967 RepID=A0A1S8AY45_9EURY|nr:hypothetical protein [Natrinema saccharevitans]OLZ41562.1 hypothetical protein A6E15_11465 [Natrinema saccharevitans]